MLHFYCDADDRSSLPRKPSAPPSWQARPRRGQYRVFQPTNHPNHDVLTHPIQPVPTQRTKGIFVFSTLYHQIVVGPTATDQESRTDRTVDPDTIDELTETVQRILPQASDWTVVGDYVGIRPGTNRRDYQIHLTADQNYLVCAGIRSTGLTASLGIGRHVVQTLQSAGILPTPTVLPAVTTRPLPAVCELAEAYRESGSDESVWIDGYRYKVTHPLTRFGFAAGTGIAAS